MGINLAGTGSIGSQDIGGSPDRRREPFGDERMEPRERHGAGIVPCREGKLYGLRKCTDIDVRTAACNKVGCLRSESHKPTVAVDRCSVAGSVPLHQGSRIISGNEACDGPIPVMQINLLTAHASYQIGRSRRKGHISSITTDGRPTAVLVSGIGRSAIVA